MCNCCNENEHKCSCGCDCGEDCQCGCNGNTNKEIALDLCKALIQGRPYTADKVAETYKILYEAVKSCN